MKNPMRALIDGQSCAGPGVGIAVKIAEPTIVEIAGLVGFDWVFFDMEHTRLGLRELEELARAAQVHGLGTVVRPPSPRSELLHAVLDLGLDAVLAPAVESHADVRHVVSMTRFPPVGERGVGEGTRGTDFGLAGPSRDPDFASRANGAQVVGVMIETAGAVAEIEHIVRTDGLDFIFVGPEDLSASMGHIGQRDHPEVREAVVHVLDVAAATGMAFAMGAGHPAAPVTAEELVERGARLILRGSDIGVLVKGMRDARETTTSFS